MYIQLYTDGKKENQIKSMIIAVHTGCEWTDKEKTKTTPYKEDVCAGRTIGRTISWTDEDDL